MLLILLNSIKTMDLRVKVPARLTPTRPAFLETAAQLAKPLAKVEAYRLEMGSKVKPQGARGQRG